MGKALIVGATGMVGTALIDAADRGELMVLARRAVAGLPPRVTPIVAPPEEWATHIAAVRPHSLFNCLGTTIRQAGSQAAFRAVDHDLVLTVAQAAKAAGTPHFISVSSVGASARSSNFYLRTKGEVEQALRAIGFDRLDILRPGLLTGERGGPWRPGESIAMALAPFTDMMLHGSARRYRSIPAGTVARAMTRLAAAGGEGCHVHEHDAICALADVAE